jgi:ABC-type multidrug transport system permease subunit
MANFDFAGWLQVVLPTAALIAGLNTALTQFLGKWVSGKAQTAVAGITGLGFGIVASLAFFGTPNDLLGWFLAVVFGLIVFGTSVGTYEAVKHAAIKANGG